MADHAAQRGASSRLLAMLTAPPAEPSRAAVLDMRRLDVRAGIRAGTRAGGLRFELARCLK